MPFASPDHWRKAAMQRLVVIDAREVERRRVIAEEHYGLYGIPDAEALADHELYILGKMELEEYRDYLLFKGMYEIGGEG